VSVIQSSELEFAALPGRLSADPLRAVESPDVSVRRVTIEPTPTRNLHRHPHSPEVVYVVAGSGTSFRDGTATPVGPGDIVWIPTGTAHATVPSAGSTLELVCFFPHGDLKENLEELTESVSIEE
jgi:quercetin dioxygenase-like cupin family protein